MHAVDYEIVDCTLRESCDSSFPSLGFVYVCVCVCIINST